jgi:adenosylmethionine-8-amino-7-oxononanoate aminotransferase
MFFHSSSYTANPIACAAAVANLAIWREEPVLERIATLVECQSARLAQVAALPGISGARQLGTITALEIGANADGYLADVQPRMLAFFRERDLLLRPMGTTVYVMPPYCIDDTDLDAVWAAIAAACELGS